MPKTYDCIMCTEATTNMKIILIEDSPVCFDCVTTMFTAAVANEKDYPPTWGDQVLTLEMFVGIVPYGVSKAFRGKEAEYLTPPEERIYCVEGTEEGQEVCDEFVGQKMEQHDAMKMLAANKLSVMKWKKCDTPHCHICGELAPDRHLFCSGPNKDDNDPTSAYAGLIKGKDYQICPEQTCKRRIQLKEACNHIRCNCGTYFCYICGEEADITHYHRRFKDSVCPRFSHPSDPNALYNTPYPDLVLDNPAILANLQRDLVREQAQQRRRNAVVGMNIFEGIDDGERRLDEMVMDLMIQQQEQEVPPAPVAAPPPPPPRRSSDPPPEAQARERADRVARMRGIDEAAVRARINSRTFRRVQARDLLFGGGREDPNVLE